MSRFVANKAGVQREVEAKVGAYVRKFGEDVERRAKNYALVGYTAPRRAGRPAPGQLKKSTKVDFGPSNLSFRLWSYQMHDGINVAYIIHQGHARIKPVNSKYLRFYPRGGPWQTKQEVRQVAGYPWLLQAVRDANQALPADARFVITVNDPYRTAGRKPRLAKF